VSNPLIADRKDSTTAFSGVPLMESVEETKKAIEGGDWAAGVLGVTGAALDAVGMAMDPFGAILAAGVGWLMEHVGPVSEALDSLTGDPDEIKAHAETWKNISTELADIGAELTNLVTNDTAGWTGEAGDAYRARSKDTSNLITAAQKAADGAANGITSAGEMVGAVRTLVRDLIADLVGHLVSWALQVVATLGIGLTWVVPQVVAEVTKVASKIADITSKLTQAMKNLIPLLDKLGDSFGDAGKALKNIKAGNAGPAGTKPAGTKGLDGPMGGGKRGPGDGVPAGTHSTGAEAKGPPPAENPKGDNSPGNGGNNSTGANGAPHLGGNKDQALAGTKSAGTDSSKGLREQGSNPRPLGKLRCEGDPIDVSTGQMVLTETDVRFEGALPLEISRTHFSKYRLGRWFGRSWTSTLDERLEVDGSGISYTSADGTLQHFPHPTGDAWVYSDDGPRRSLGRVDDGGYLIEDVERTCLLYFAPGTSVRPLATMFDRNGNRIDFRSDESGVPTEVWHSAGYLVRVESANDRITALYLVSSDGTEVELMRYGYTDGRLTEVINESGLPMRFEYDDAERIVSWTDRNGEWYGYTYDEAGRVVRTESSGGFLSGTMEYDTENRITVSTNSLGQRTTFYMNKAGQVVKEVDPLGNAIESEWDAYDRLLRRTDPLGRTVSYEYDAAGNVIAITRPDGRTSRSEYNEFGLPVEIIGFDGTVTRREYDELGNLTKQTDPTGAATTYTYDKRGHPAAITDVIGNTTRIVADPSGLPSAIASPLGAVTRYERDQFGRTTAITTPTGDVQRFGYTVDGNLAWQQHPDGTVERWAYDGERNQHAYADGQATTRTEFAQFNLPTAEIRPDGTRLAFSYDTEMGLVSVTNEQGLVWRYEYDAAGNLARETDFNGATVSYRYDGVGQLVERTNASGEKIEFSYDVLGNVVERRCGSARTTFTYGPDGLLREAVDGDNRVSFTYDAAGRVTSENINGRVVESSYDALGRRVWRRTPSGAETTWEYDASHQHVAVHLAGRTLRFQYDPVGREVARALDSGMVINHAWTPTDLLASQTVTSATGQRSQQRLYAYRADGTLSGIQDALTGPRTFALDMRGRVTGVQAAGWTERYAYDPAGNVAQAAWPTTADQDVLGARTYTGTLIRSAGNTRYEHDDQGRMVLRQRKRLTHKTETWRYFWDAEDRLVGAQTPDGTRWRYRYDPLGRRISKQRLVPDGSVVERVEFTWDGAMLAEQVRFEADAGPARATVWDYEPGGFRPLSQRERLLRAPQEWVDEQFYAIVTDLVGTPTELVNDQGGIAWFQRTSLWGETLDRRHTAADTPLRFPGQYYDSETGLHYNFFRYYDPAIGRYASPDPLGLVAGPNNHAYVENPQEWLDPLGLMCQGGGKRKGPPPPINTTIPANFRTEHSPGGTANHYSPGGNTRLQQSPTYGRIWQLDGVQSPPPGVKKQSKRDTAGFTNPNQMDPAGRKILRQYMDTPMPPGLKVKQQQEFMNKPTTKWNIIDTHGNPAGTIEGRKNDDGKSKFVMGHKEAASDLWGNGRHQYARDENLKLNRDPAHYQGLELEKESAGSGSKESRYIDPQPGRGSHESHFNPGHPDYFPGNPFPAWKEYNPPANGGGPPPKKPKP
jgi:RHS repeat-associated protein